MRYFAGWSNYKDRIANTDAADMNGDGKLTRADAMILARHVAGWDGYETLPYKTYSFYGIITDNTNKIVGATIAIYNDNYSATVSTDANGLFICKVPNGWYDISITVDGYNTKIISSCEMNGTDRNLGTIKLDSTDEFSDYVYASEEDFSYKFNPDKTTIEITGYRGSGGNIIIQDTIDGYKVTVLGTAFEGNTSLTGVKIPDGITLLCEWAFDGCTNLSDIHIPNTVTYIGGMAFYGCAITELVIPECVNFIGSHTFRNCSQLKAVYFAGDRPRTVGHNSFIGVSKDFVTYYVEGMDGWTSPTWNPDPYDGYSYSTATWIPSNKRIKTFIMDDIRYFVNPDGETVTMLSYLGKGDTVNIPEKINGYKVTAIANAAIRECDYVKKIIVPAGVSSIGWHAFAMNENVHSIYFYGDAIYNMGGKITENDKATVPQTWYYVAGKSGWTSPTWTAPDKTIYKTATFEP